MCPRYISDLIPKLDTKTGKEKVYLPLLQGVGGQRKRTRISVSCYLRSEKKILINLNYTQVPPKQKRRMYLGIAASTLDDQSNPYILILPAKTEVNKDLVSQNNLNCLKFDACDPKHYFDRDTKNIYLEIDEANHQSGFIEYVTLITVFFINLYYL